MPPGESSSHTFLQGNPSGLPYQRKWREEYSFHISILPSVEQKANAWNYRQYRILLAQKLIEPFTIRKAEQVRSALSYVKKESDPFQLCERVRFFLFLSGQRVTSLSIISRTPIKRCLAEGEGRLASAPPVRLSSSEVASPLSFQLRQSQSSPELRAVRGQTPTEKRFSFSAFQKKTKVATFLGGNLCLT